MTAHEAGREMRKPAPRPRRGIVALFDYPGDAETGGRSRLLSALVVVLFAWGVTWPLFLSLRLLPGVNWTHPEILLSGAFALAVLLSGLLNRRGHYLAAATFAVVLLLAGVFASLNLTLSGAMEPVFSRNDPGLLSYLVLPVVLGAVLLPLRLLLAVGALSLGATLSVPLLYPHVSWDAILYGPLLYLAVVCGLLVSVSVLLAREQRRTIAEIEEREERFRGLFEQSPDAVLVVAPDGEIRSVNGAGVALFGYPAEELVGKHASVVYANPADRDAIIGKAERQGYLHEEPVRLRTKGGAILECLFTLLLRRDAAGRTLEYQTVVRDVTARKRAEEELQLRGQLLEVERDAIMLVEPGGQVIYANRASEELTGYTTAEILAMNIRQFNTPEGAERLPEFLGAGLRDGAIELASTAVRKDGSRVDVEVRGQVFESHGRKLFLSVIRDVTARRAAEAELRLRGQLLDLANDAVFLHDLRGNLLYVNEAAAVQRGYTREELMKLTLRALDDEETAARFGEQMSELMNRRALAFEGGHRRKDGSVMPVEVRARIVDWADRGIVLSVARDISERRKAEATLKAERDRAQGYLDIAAVMLVVIDAAGNIALLNRRGAEILGAEEKNLVGRDWFDTCLPAEERGRVRSVFAAIMAGNLEAHEHVVSEVVTASGGRRTIAWHNALLRDASGRPSGTLSSGEDITERLATERALQLSEQRFRAIYEQSIDAIFENAPDGSGMLANRAWEDLFGYTEEDVATMNVSDVYVDPSDRESYVRGMLANGSVRDEVWLKKKDGTRFLGQRVASVRRDAAGRIVAFQGVIRDITALRNAETALRRSEAKFRQLFEQSLDATWILRPDGTGHEVNQAWIDMFGYSKEDLEHLNAADLYAEPSGRADFVRRMEESGSVRDEVRLKRKDGTIITTERAVVARKDDAGRVIAYQGVNRDVTEQRRAVEALRESEEKYRALFEQSLDAIYTCNKDGTHLEVNQAWLDLHGYTREDVSKLNAVDLYVDPGERAEFLERIGREGTVRDEAKFRRKDGTVIFCQRSVVARRDQEGRIVSFQGVIHDVTGLKRAAQTLADELARRRILVEQSRDGIVVLDQDGRAVETNRRFAEMLGRSPEEVLQLHVRDWDVPTPTEKLNEMIRTVDESGDHFETQHRRKDGSVYDVEISTNAAVFGGQKLIFCVCRDITRRKRAEEELRRSGEELRLLASRLEETREEERTGIARELHDQLGQALTALKLDLDGVRRAEERGETVPGANLDRMMRLLDDTTSDVRRISSELRPGLLDDVGLVAAMEWQAEQFSERSGIHTLVTARTDEAGLDRGRATALYRVLQEVLTNVARHAGARNVVVGFDRDGGNYVLTVTDDGVGITPEQSSSTSSLGLIGMRERVRPFGGSLEMEGEPGKGTTVRVVLPAR